MSSVSGASKSVRVFGFRSIVLIESFGSLVEESSCCCNQVRCGAGALSLWLSRRRALRGIEILGAIATVQSLCSESAVYLTAFLTLPAFLPSTLTYLSTSIAIGARISVSRVLSSLTVPGVFELTRSRFLQCYAPKPRLLLEISCCVSYYGVEPLLHFLLLLLLSINLCNLPPFSSDYSHSHSLSGVFLSCFFSPGMLPIVIPIVDLSSPASIFVR